MACPPLPRRQETESQAAHEERGDGAWRWRGAGSTTRSASPLSIVLIAEGRGHVVALRSLEIHRSRDLLFSLRDHTPTRGVGVWTALGEAARGPDSLQGPPECEPWSGASRSAGVGCRGAGPAVGHPARVSTPPGIRLLSCPVESAAMVAGCPGRRSQRAASPEPEPQPQPRARAASGGGC